MKNYTKTILSIFCATCILATTTACMSNNDLVLNELGKNVVLHTNEQLEFLTSPDYQTFNSWLTPNGEDEASHPVPVHFSWTVNANLQNQVEKYVVEISESNLFSNKLRYETKEPEIDVYNLCVATDYYWRVTAYLSNGSKKVSKQSMFQTEYTAPRNIYVDGITNVRDLGGWMTVDGEYVKQGMMYRCARLNVSQLNTIEVEITEKGIKTMRDELNICTEIDLRMDEAHVGCVHGLETSGLTSSLLGDDVNYYNVPMEYVMGSDFNYLTDTRFYPSIRQFFTYVADETNYPLIFHCNIGTDRTGLFAFLINGLLGVSEENLYRDYLYSNFGDIGEVRTLTNIKSYIEKIKTYDGEYFSEQIENCLLDIGVSAEEIDELRLIMIE